MGEDAFRGEDWLTRSTRSTAAAFPRAFRVDFFGRGEVDFFSHVKINKDLADRLPLKPRHPDPSEVEFPVLLGHQLPVPAQLSTHAEMRRIYVECPSETLQSAGTDPGFGLRKQSAQLGP